MRTLLLNPPFEHSKGFNREGRCTQKADFWSTPWPPYSLASIAAAIRGDREVRILDCPAQKIDEMELREWVAGYQPDLVLSSSSTQTIDSDLRVLRDLKSAFGLKTAVFGIHASVFSKEIVTASGVDFVVRNEPEDTARELVSTLEKGGDAGLVRGLAFAGQNGQAVLTEPRPFIKDLDALPAPAWDLVDLDRYRLPLYGRRFLIVSTIRGCPFRCAFCNGHAYYGSKARTRSVPSLIEEIKDGQRRYGIDDFFFWGDTFTLVKEQVQALCRRIIDEGLGIQWVANSRVDTVDAETLRLMRRAGCWMLSYGIESGDDAVLRRCGKGTTRDRVVEAVQLSKAAGLKVAGHFILGLPGETEASAQKTLDLARALDLDFANFYAAVPFPGSALYDEALNRGWLRHRDWPRFTQSEFIMDLPTIATSRLREIRKKAYRASLLRPKNIGLAADALRSRVLRPRRRRPEVQGTGEKTMYVLGIWDGHDSGAALLKDGQIVFAANEERFTRKKLEVEFPYESVREALKFAGIGPAEVGVVAISTSDFAKTLTRVFPGLKRRYYLIRRRKVRPTLLSRFSKTSKYVLTEIGPSRLTRAVSSWAVNRALKSLGFSGYRLVWVNHHLAHAAAAVGTSPFPKGLFLSLDGIGDGLSGMLGTFDGGEIRVLKEYRGRDSLGIFFEHVTNLLNMRELEDEGKVMALASFGYPIPDSQNPLLPLFAVDGLSIKAKYHAVGLYRKLKEVLFLYPSEQFAYMAQRVLEVCITQLVENARRTTGLDDLAYAGGVASNIKVNMLLKNSPGFGQLYIFPHMGDGGLALGAAIRASQEALGTTHVDLNDLFLGPAPDPAAIESEIRNFDVRYERFPAIEKRAAELIGAGEILLWFQGRMEYGPRALGDRSILAVPNSVAVKNRLNVFLKKRVWYQPFCPSMLEEDAAEVLEDHHGVNNRFMTVGYKVKDRYADSLVAVINADNSCRPQILGAAEAPLYGRYVPLLRQLKERTGFGIVLNTSFNKHGESIINTPREALELLMNSHFKYLVLEDTLVWKKESR